MPEVFLTGGTGFIGGALLRRLLDDGRTVRALVRTEVAAARIDRLGAEPVLGDITDAATVRRAIEGCATCFHVAGLNAMCLRDSGELERVNVEGTRNVVAAAAGAGIQRIVHTSSAATIGERRGEIGTEATPHRGSYNTAYERSKHLAEQAAFSEASRFGVDLVAVNPSSVQGPGRTGGTARFLIAYLRGRLRFVVDTRMSLVFIDDVVQAHLDAEAKGVPGERYLVSGWTTTVGEAIGTLSRVTGEERRVWTVPAGLLSAAAAVVGTGYRIAGRDAPLCAEMARAVRHGHAFDGSRIEREWGLAYTPPEEWLTRTVEWYRAEGLV